MSIAQIGQPGCPCTYEMMRHRFQKTDGEPENPPSAENRPKQHGPHRMGFAGHLAANMVNEMDSEGDKALCQCETELSEETFNSIDSDGDGLLTGREIAAGLRDNRENVATALGIERPEDGERPEPGKHPGRRHAFMRQAVDAYEGSMSDLMVAAFEPSSSTGAEVVADTLTGTATSQDSLDLAV